MASITSWSIRCMLRSRGAAPFILRPNQRIVTKIPSATLCQVSNLENNGDPQASPDDTDSRPDLLKLSDSCVKQLKNTLTGEDKDGFLRIEVEGGGCSGFQYKFSIDSKLQKDDRVFEKEGTRVVVDDLSLEYLKGSTVDYHEELIRSAFRIVLNPNAEKGCSCGTSFSLKL